MPVQYKRKRTAVEDQHSSKQRKSAKIQKSIHAFGTVGKQHDVYDQGQKRNVAQAPPTPTPQRTTARAENKRKHEAVSDDEDEIVVSLRGSALKQKTRTKTSSTPRNERFKNTAPPTPVHTPTRGTLALLDRLNIDENSHAIPCKLQNKRKTYDTPPDTPTDETIDLDLSLPSELQDLQSMYSSLLASLSLYYSYNGSTSPVNVRALLPMITDHWGKRDVNVGDLRRVMAIGEPNGREFSIQNYGRAGICVTRDPADRRTSSFVDEKKLNSRFRDNLLRSWTSWQASTPKENGNTTTFLDQIPLAEITLNESVQNAAPLFARGQQRLADLKASKSASKPSAQSSPSQSSPQPSPQATQHRSTALLDRILAKQSSSAKLPAGPTREQLERRSALHRIEDIVRVLSLLAGTKERCSFSVPAIIQHLQQSLRNPISAEEVEKCLQLMSSEIVPLFVRLVQSGEVKGVIITRGANVGLAELRAKVERACA